MIGIPLRLHYILALFPFFRSKEEKKAEKEKNDAIAKEYGICVIDGHEEKVGNFRIEPPGRLMDE